MTNQKTIHFEVTSKISLQDILNKLISEKKEIINVITTVTNCYGVVKEGVIIYKDKFSFFIPKLIHRKIINYFKTWNN